VNPDQLEKDNQGTGKWNEAEFWEFSRAVSARATFGVTDPDVQLRMADKTALGNMTGLFYGLSDTVVHYNAADVVSGLKRHSCGATVHNKGKVVRVLKPARGRAGEGVLLVTTTGNPESPTDEASSHDVRIAAREKPTKSWLHTHLSQCV